MKPFLAVCLAPIFGAYQHWFLLLQFIEWYKILAVNKIFAYYHNCSDSATKILLGHYMDGFSTDFFELISLPTTTDCATEHSCRHDFQLNDCVYRSMNRYRFVALVDIDELLVPMQHATLIELIQ